MASRAQIAARQARIFARLERKTKQAVRAEITRASMEIIRVYTLTREVMPAYGHVDRLRKIYLDLATLSISTMGREFNRQFKDAGMSLEIKEDLSEWEQWALDYINSERIRERIVDVSETTREIIIDSVDKGFRAGAGQQEIAKEITERVPEISSRRAGVIARTETHGASNYGTQRMAESIGVPMRKVWISGQDDRVRKIPRDGYDHRQMDGVKVGMDEPFLVPSKAGPPDAIMYPGDPAGAAGNVINCRCTLSHEVIKDFTDDDIFAGLD